MEKINIICLLWEGTFIKKHYKTTKYTLEWVQKLYNMVSRNLTQPFTFYCLTNADYKSTENINFIKLRYCWPGWWSKMELFRSDIPDGKNVYFDLDILIIDNILPIVDYPSEIAIGSMFGVLKDKNRLPRGVIQGYNSSVIVFKKGEISYQIWESFESNAKHWMNRYRGDQDFLKDFFPDIDILPIKWIVKTKSCITETGNIVPSKNAKIVLCRPEKNNIAVQKYEFVKNIWK